MTREGADVAVTPDEFLRNLRDSGLTPARDLLPTGATAAAMAQRLVEDGNLTRFQADAVLTRRFDDLVMGNYEILDRLGAGGMGTVFKARHRRMKRIVALKVLSREVARSESFAQRFQREVETIARLTHPNVVMAFDADESKMGPFLVMEFVDGHDLAGEVTQAGPLSVADAVECTLQAARGLEYAHSQGIVHRDIKPANLMRDVSGVVKVTDLGLARLNATDGTANTSLTQAGGIVGTMDYMPPEQALDSTAIDHRVDTYSLGCSLYFLLTGRPPFEGNTIMALLLKHREAPIPSLCAARLDIPAELDAIFRRMVAKKPEDRQPTMADVVRELDTLKKSIRLSDTRPAGAAARLGAAPDMSGATITYGSNEASTARDPLQTMVSDGVGTDTSIAEAGKVAGRVVVLAEPSRVQAGIIRRYLEQLKVGAVHPVGSGHQAFEVAKREAADVILCSMQLSDMTGLHLAHMLLADPACGRLGLVLATSEADMEEAAALMPDSPRVILMPKPFDQQRLAASLAKVVG